MKRIVILMLVAAVWMIGCTEDRIVEPPEVVDDDFVTWIEFRGLPDSVSEYEGATKTLSFSVIARDMYSNGVPEERIEVSLVSGGATITRETFTTDENGRIEAIIRFVVPLGKSSIRLWASSREILSTTTIQLIGNPMPACLELRLEDSDTTDQYLNFISTIKDIRGNSIADVHLEFSLIPIDNDSETFGSITNLLHTDEDGTGVALFNSQGQFGTQKVKCVVAEGELEDPPAAELTIEINEIPESSARLSLTAQSDFIYADGSGCSSTIITAYLGDSEQHALAGKEITFTSNFEHVVLQPMAVTNEDGMAVCVFDDLGIPTIDHDTGLPEPAIITANYTEENVSSEISIMIRERLVMGRIDVYVGARAIEACVGDTLEDFLRFTMFLSDGSLAPAGYIIPLHLFTDNGHFVTSVLDCRNNILQYVVGSIKQPANIWVAAISGEDSVVSRPIDLTFSPKPIAFASLNANPEELIISDPNSYSIITTMLTDSCGHPVREGTYVSFSATLGTITPSARTDEYGRAVAILRPGVEAGIAEITASAQGIIGIATVTFLAGTPGFISLDADPLNIQVRGGGGITTSTLRVTVRDSNRNLIETPVTVVWELIDEPDPPEGTVFSNGEHIFVTTSDRAPSLIAGTRVGDKLIRVYAWRDSLADPTDIISSEITIVVVGASEPAEIEIEVNNEGIDAGGGAWIIEVSARITDEHGNPVEDRIPVIFSIDLQNASINPGFTGNENRHGDVIPGFAFTDIVYNSQNTGDTITISATVSTPNGDIVVHLDYVLPLQQGVLVLNVDPANWMFEEGREVAEIRCSVLLNDGHQIEINGMPVLFTVNRGRLGWKDENDELHMFGNEPARAFAGNGEWATVYLIAEEDEIFRFNDIGDPIVFVNASVEGYEDVSADPFFIWFFR